MTGTGEVRGGIGSEPDRTALAAAPWSVMICLLGGFRVLRASGAITVPPESKAGLLLRRLALAGQVGVPRAELLGTLWVDAHDTRANACFNSLVTEVRKALRDALGDASPIVNGDGCYRLNRAAGVAVDVECFDEHVDRGHRAHAEGRTTESRAAYEAALTAYQGDLYVGRGLGDELLAYVEQERLRSRCMIVLGRAAALAGRAGDHDRAMTLAWRLLALDPCSEVGHRLMMHGYMVGGQRAQALRQFRICCEVMRLEYGTSPEPSTLALFERVRDGSWTVAEGFELVGG